MIADIKDGTIFGNIFFADHNQLNTAKKGNDAKRPLNDAEIAIVIGSLVEFGKDPFKKKDRNGTDQKENNKEQGDNCTYHKRFLYL